MGVITYDSIKLTSPYELKHLNELKIVKKVNDHATVYFTGIIPEEKKDSYIDMATAHDKIEVIQDGRTLFKGLVSNVGIRFVRGIYYIEVEGLSHTCELDVKLKSRSFQNKGMSYKDMLGRVVGKYPGADYKDSASNGSTLGGLVVQYNETDWQFIKRMASRLGAVLVPESASDMPKFWFGIPNEKEGSLPEGFHYTAGSRNECTYYEVESDSFLDLGWKVNFKEKSMVVVQSTAVMKNGTLKYEYVFAPKDGIKQRPIENNPIIGAAIEGKVIDIENDTVKVHLEIDQEQSKGEACWFKYATGYAAEGNSGWYCMPQPGDSVKLYFPTESEDSAVIITSVRKGGQSNPKTADPDIKYFGTDHGKEMKLGKKDLMLASKENQLSITLDEDNGIEIQSDKSILLSTEKDLTINADKSFTVSAGEGLYLSCNESIIIMDGETHVKGSIVQMEGYIKSPISLSDVFDMVKEAVMAPVDAALGVAGMVASVGSAVASGDLVSAGMTVASCVPVVGTAIQAANAAGNIMNEYSAGVSGGMRA